MAGAIAVDPLAAAEISAAAVEWGGNFRQEFYCTRSRDWVTRSSSCAMRCLVAERGGEVVLQCQRALRRLFQGVAGVSEVIEAGQSLPPFDFHCPLMSLPGVFATSLDSIPSPGGYLKAEPTLIDEWGSGLAIARG